MQGHAIRSSRASTIAIDQHARSVAMCALDISTGETRSTRLAGCPTAGDIVGWAAAWATPPMRFVCEPGPCGFQLARDIRALGHDCDMTAASSIARSADDKRLKDDRRDAASLLGAVTAPGSKCRAVWVPSEEAEAARDLVRAYFDMVASTKRLAVRGASGKLALTLCTPAFPVRAHVESLLRAKSPCRITRSAGRRSRCPRI